MADVDYEALARQYGGKPVDYDAIARELGGKEVRKVGAPERALAAVSPVAVGETALSMATGGAGAVAGGLAGLAQGATNALGLTTTPAGDRVQQVSRALTYEPRTPGGRDLTGAVSAPFELIAEGADAAGAATTDATGSPAAGAAVNTAIQSAPALLNRGAKAPVSRANRLAQERADVLARINDPRDRALLEGKKDGMSIPAADANPTIFNRVLQAFSGDAQTQRLHSAKNQPFVQRVVRRGLGMADDAPITMDALEAVRRREGRAYEQVRQIGEIATDDAYRAALQKVVDEYEGAAKSFPEEASPVMKAADSARVDKFDADAAVSKIKLERKRADKAFRQGDSELGKAHKAIADALEEQIDRHITAMDNPPANLANFRKAREIIAKSYDVQKALKGTEVDGRVLAKQLAKKNISGGDFGVLRQNAENFPRAFQTGMEGKNAPQIADYLAGGAAALTSGNVLPLALAGARPGTRAAMATGPYQSVMGGPRSYGPGNFRTLSDLATSDPALMAELVGLANANR